MQIQFLEDPLFIESEVEILEEADGRGGKSLFLSGIMMQGGVKNRNGREYPPHEIAEAVKAVNERLKNGESVLGELDHPQSLTVNLDRVSHSLTEAKMDGDNAVGKLKILDTPMGRIAKTLIQGGVKLGVSSRGTGKVDESGRVSGFKFATMDIVHQPSAPNAFPESVMESLQSAGIKFGTEHKPRPLREILTEDRDFQKYALEQFLKEIKKNV
jgi:hypothetical protein